jgi:hypothetical protein
LACAAHFALFAPAEMRSVDDYLAAGRCMQRFWLTGASQGLYIQPEMTPVIFTRYSRQGMSFTRVERARSLAQTLNTRLSGLLAGQAVDSLYFMGRMGTGPAPQARSTRKPLESLIRDNSS